MKSLRHGLIAALILTLILGACQSPPDTPLEEYPILWVEITPSARPASAAVQACAGEVADVHLRIRERYPNQADAEVLIQLGDMGESGRFLAQIATEEIGIILHPDNPAGTLTPAGIADLFSGRVTNWLALGGADQPVSVWALIEADESRQGFEAEILSGLPLASSAGLAPDPDALQQAVLADPGAVGFLPATALDADLRLVLTGVRLPVLVSAAQPLSEPVESLIACLQGEIGQAALSTIYP